MRILASVGGVVILSLLGSVLSLYRITGVNHTLDAITRVSVPLGRILSQLQSDAEILRREMDRRLGYSHWGDSHWRAQPVPRWIGEVLEHEIQKARQLVSAAEGEGWLSDEDRHKWLSWVDEIADGHSRIQAESRDLYAALKEGDRKAAAQVYPQWVSQVENWYRRLDWGVREYDRALRRSFAGAQRNVTDLRTGLQVILVAVVLLSLLLLWLGERALRPLQQLTRLARDITERGLRKEDKSRLPAVSLSRNDEVSALAREFHRMATVLLEREKTVESQTTRLEVQNRLLREMGTLNENILNSIESVLIVTDLDGGITQCNPGAEAWLGRSSRELIGVRLLELPQLVPFRDSLSGAAGSSASSLGRLDESFRIPPTEVGGKTYGGQVLPLRTEEGSARGMILVLEDLTEQLDLENRLRLAENLAAVGRLSAQVAHEVRNPLHSIGLEAELALEAAEAAPAPVRQSLQSILAAVDRLENITENYLKLSRLSSGEKTRFDLRDALESVLATYSPACEAQGVSVDWKIERGGSYHVHGDRSLIEQVLGNLFRNALQALQSGPTGPGDAPAVVWRLGNTEAGHVWMQIRDNGPGIPEAVRPRLFNPFVTSKAQGTGLGLSFSRKVVQDHGGDLKLADEAGTGACFEIVLPGAPVTRGADRGQVTEQTPNTESMSEQQA